MHNKNYFHAFAAVLLVSVYMAGCEHEAPPAPADTVRLVKTVLLHQPGGSNVRQFPGTIEASQKVDLAFRVAGTLQELPVKEGYEVNKGDILARLDPTDIRLVYNDRKAAFDSKAADYERAKKLVREDTISRSDFDRIEADYKSARARLASAREDLDSTALRASFDGYVARKYVDNFQEINARQAILSLQDISSLEVKFDIPESLAIRVRRGARDRTDGKVFALFESIGDERFPLTFKEASTQADEKTQTYKITFSMESPENYRILPGMSTTVIVNTTDLVTPGEQFHMLPIGAVVGDVAKQPTVWIVDQETMTVAPKKVQAGILQGDQIQVFGLSPGQRVVVAGVPYLREGMKVSLLETGEQPE